MNASYIGTFPTSASTFTNHSFTKSTPETSGVTGSSSKVIQQSAHRSSLQNLHPQFASHIEYCNNLPERKERMGNSGTIIISSGVHQLQFPISKKVKHCLPLPWPETASDLHYPGYRTPVFQIAYPFPWRGLSIDTRSSGSKRWSISKANMNHTVEYGKCTGGVNQRWKLHQCFLGCCLFRSAPPAGKGATLPPQRKDEMSFL